MSIGEQRPLIWTAGQSKEYWGGEIKKLDSVEGMIAAENCWNPYHVVSAEVVSFIHNSIPLVEDGLVTVDYGCWSGKWTRDLIDISSNIINVDMYEESEKCISMRHGDYARAKDCTMEYYVTSGNELKGLANCSVDYIFSMDSIVRSSTGIISDLSREFNRVLKPGGTCLLNVYVERAKSELAEFSGTWQKKSSFCAEYFNPRTHLIGPNRTSSCYVVLEK
jgi:SAM-dependent methyltransferase